MKIFIALIFIFVSIYALNYLTPETRGDDITYKFSFVPGLRDKRVENFKNVIASQFYHYFKKNGRTSVHTVVQIFAGIWGKRLFNVFNALVYVLFVFMVTKFFGKINFMNLLFSSSLIFLLFPEFFKTMLWLSGAVNYLWVCSGICLLLYFIPKLKHISCKPVMMLLFIPGLILGFSHEGIVTPLAASFIIYLIIRRKEVNNTAVLPLIVGFIIGSFACSLSPATLIRSMKTTDSFAFMPVEYRLYNSWIVLKNNTIFLLLIGIISFLMLQKRRNVFKWLKKIYIENILLFNALFFSFFVLFLSGETMVRVGCATSFFSLLIIASLVNKKELKIPSGLKISLITVSLIFYSFVLPFCIQNYKEYKHVISQLDSHQSSIILYNNIKAPGKIQQYLGYPLSATMIVHKNSNNKRYGQIYGYDSVYFMPEKLYHYIMNDGPVEKLNCRKLYDLYVIRLKEEQIDPKPYALYKITSSSGNNHPGYEYIEKELSPQNYEILKFNDTNYLFASRVKYNGKNPSEIIIK